LIPALLLLAALPASLGEYAGNWKLIPAESDSIPAVIDKTVSRMNFLIRGIARSRLRRTQVAFPQITISAGNEFRIRHQGGTDVPHRATDTDVPATAPDGTRITVRLSAGPPLTESYESTEGKRENTYVLSGDRSKMTLNVRVTSPRLSSPILYRLVYARSD
jgi:hypothetical protein